MEFKESGIESGTHSPSIGHPLIQMGALLHPLDLGHARAVDITTALSTLQAEVALLNAHLTVLRITTITELDQAAQLRSENALALTHFEHMFADAHKQILDNLQLVADYHRDSEHRYLEVADRLMQLTMDVNSIPETYLLTRMKRWFRNQFRRLSGV